MKISKSGYQPGATRKRTRFALLPVIAMDVKIWFKWYTTTEVLSKVAGTKDDYEWEVISLIYW